MATDLLESTDCLLPSPVSTRDVCFLPQSSFAILHSTAPYRITKERDEYLYGRNSIHYKKGTNIKLAPYHEMRHITSISCTSKTWDSNFLRLYFLFETNISNEISPINLTVHHESQARHHQCARRRANMHTYSALFKTPFFRSASRTTIPGAIYSQQVTSPSSQSPALAGYRVLAPLVQTDRGVENALLCLSFLAYIRNVATALIQGLLPRSRRSSQC